MYAVKVNVVGDVDAGDALALLALLVSLVALLRPLWLERRAVVEVRNEHVVVPDRKPGSRGSTERYVVKNQGPAAARDVEVTFAYDDPAQSLSRGGYNQPRTPVLHPGEELQLPYYLAMGDKSPQRVVVSWRDSRFRKQTQEFYPAVREIFLV
jgi:hypothetical protein